MRFCIVLVTFNRLALLQKALKAYENQSKLPSMIIVVNNGSNDGTREYLDNWKTNSSGAIEKVVINCEENSGGSGGFSQGVEKALTFDSDFIFLADDDAIADSAMLLELENFYAEQKYPDNIVALCTAVINNGMIETNHRRRIYKTALRFRRVPVSAEEYQSPFALDEISFVGAVIKTSIARRIGLPRKDFFICYDDFEYSNRLRACGQIYCVPLSIMNHEAEFQKKGASITWRNYYSQRNYLFCIKNQSPWIYYAIRATLCYIQRASFYARWFRGRTKSETDLFKAAIFDAARGNLGTHPQYRPRSKVN